MNCPEIVETRHGRMMVRRNDKYIGDMLARYGEYVPKETRVLSRLMPAGGVAVDVGANIGATSLAIAEAGGESGVVIAFEPQRQLYYMLCGNVALNGAKNVYCLHKAAGAKAGAVLVPELDLGREGNFGGLSLLDAEAYSKDHEMIPVDMMRIDDLRLSRCDLIKIDVEGMELEVLEGASETIKGHMPTICVEDNRPALVPRLVAWLDQAGYLVFQHFPPLFSEDNFRGEQENIYGETVSANLVCVHASRPVPDWLADEGMTTVVGKANIREVYDGRTQEGHPDRHP